MKEITKARAAASATGCALILTTGTGLTTVLNAMIPDLMSGMGNPPLTLFMLGPSLATIFAFIGSLVATQLLEKLTPKWSLLLGTLVVTLMLVIFAMTSSVYWWIFANALNGVVLSFGAHAAASAVTAKFWGGRTQSVYGVISGAYSLLVAAEVFLVAFLMSVTDYRTVLWIFAGLSLGIGVFSNLVLIGRVPKHAPDEGEAARQAQKAAVDEVGVSLKEALRGPTFYLFAIVMFIGAWAMSAVSTFSTVFFTTYGVQEAVAASYFGIHTLVGAVLMLFAGFITRKFGTRVSGVLVFGFFIVGILSLFVWASVGGFPLVFAGMALTSAILIVAILPSLFIPELFGMKHYASINAACMAMYFLGHSVVMIALSGLTEALGINNAFLFTAGLGAVAIVCVVFAYVTRPMKKLAKASSAPSASAPAEA
ncbi:MAG TPA: MFS transporter [Gordonibacter urolithinfaciens]|uniref:MFS transporter n=1 Tax=Gordonibacter TaxID=644652 RepID=UPI001DCE90A8|nr:MULTISPECIES: MFS transporter [Gordonibacter]MDN4508435.1 MFS transporter [Gordonibacter sp. RACS_AR49]HJF61902.1 MFS transporter [Gordonibacter urolithinfaciens]